MAVIPKRSSQARSKRSIENLVVNGKEFTPSDAARYVAQHIPSCSWIPSPVRLGAALTLPGEDLIRVYALAKMFTVEEEQDSDLPLSDLELPSERQFEIMVDEYQTLITADPSYGQEKWSGSATDSEAVAALCEMLAAEFSCEIRRQQWRPYAICSGIHGGTAREVWERVIGKIEEACEAGARHSMVLHHQPKLSPDFTAVRQKQLASELVARLENGGKLGLFQLVTRSEWRSFIKTATVAAGGPSHRDHFDAPHRLAHLEEVRQELGSLWDGIVGQPIGITFASIGVQPEQACRGAGSRDATVP